KAEFLHDKRDVYDDWIAQLGTAAGPEQLLNLMERSRGPAVAVSDLKQALKPGEALVEYWKGKRNSLTIWITRGKSGFGKPVADRLWIVPDGNAGAVSAESETIFLPTASMLPHARRASNWHWPWQLELAAYGDPEITAALPGETWQELPNSRTEIEGI